MIVWEKSLNKYRDMILADKISKYVVKNIINDN